MFAELTKHCQLQKDDKVNKFSDVYKDVTDLNEVVILAVEEN